MSESTKALTRDDVRPHGGCCGQFKIDPWAVSGCGGCPVVTAVLDERIAANEREKALAREIATLRALIPARCDAICDETFLVCGNVVALAGADMRCRKWLGHADGHYFDLHP
jgi:hypothetical protein